MVVDLRSRILQKKDIKEKEYYVESWEEKLLLKGLSGKQRGKIVGSCVNPSNGKMDLERMYPMLVVAGAFDPESRKPVFTSADLSVVGDKDGGTIESIAIEIMNLSGMSKDAKDALEKNFGPTPNDDSISR